MSRRAGDVDRVSRGEDALRAARSFALAAPPLRAEPLGNGHIHDTFSVSCDAPSGEVRYVLQRLNTRVFLDPEAVVANAALITRTLAADPRPADAVRRGLRCLESARGELLVRDPDGGVWRGFDRIEGTRSFDRVESPEQARRAARAFGDFVAGLSQLDPERLKLTIPGFHDFGARRAAFERAVADDVRGRARDAAPEIEALRDAARTLERDLPPERLAALPIRVVHNDCKLNNVLFDETSGEAVCVIDLDTVMPGSLLFDFGDLVRTAACSEPEDSRDLDRVRVEAALYRSLARGFLEGVGEIATGAERELLPLAGPLIALETGMRFLADHLDGDRYFRVAREGHNLDRARTQLRLTQGLLAELGTARRWLLEADAERRQSSAAAGK